MELNLATVTEAVALRHPTREAIVWGDLRLTYGQLNDRARRLANHLLGAGLAVRAERDQLEPWESGQDHLALYLFNGNEYLEGMLGAYKARVAPFNVNYRYVEEELRYLLDDAGAKAIIYHSQFAPRLAAIRDDLPELQVFLQVADDSGNDLLPGAQWYEEALAAADPGEPPVTPSVDDLYILYTGGTTGMPKGVLWRQADIFVAALGGRHPLTGEPYQSLDEILEISDGGAGTKVVPAPPFMHGAAHWLAFNAFSGGYTIVIPPTTTVFDAPELIATIRDEQVNILLVVGDAFARPIVDSLERDPVELPSLVAFISGGAALSAPIKDRILAVLPGCAVIDAVGASETGQQARQITAAGQSASTGTFSPAAGMCIVSEDLTHLLSPDDKELGWLAQAGQVPLGYLGDEAKTTRTFPTIDGVRYSVPGDRANYTGDGLLELHGRDSVTINSGGEKIFAEEVEAALAHHAAVYDSIVTGRPSERWGNEVIAVVQLRDGAQATPDELLAEMEKHLARYKLPKAFVFVDRIQRSPSGKADYRWAKEQAG